MTMAFDKRDPEIPTERWKGVIETVFEDVTFNGLIGLTYDERATLVEIPVENIVESERSRVAYTIMFFADVEVVEENVVTVRGIEFIEPGPINH